MKKDKEPLSHVEGLVGFHRGYSERNRIRFFARLLPGAGTRDGLFYFLRCGEEGLKVSRKIWNWNHRRNWWP